MMRRAVLAAALFLLCAAAGAQEFTPVVKSFTKADYNADSQNWAVETDPDGILYVGNNRGLLTFDGFGWDLYPLPQNKVVRCLLSDSGRIYAGSYEEFGYFSRAANGVLVYTSLSDRLEGYDMQNDEIWRIVKVRGRVVFQAFRSWFILDGDSVKAVESGSFVEFFSAAGGRVFARSEDYGFSEVNLDTAELTKVPGVPFRSPCIGILPFGNAFLAVTYSDGLYLMDDRGFTRFPTGADDLLRTSQVNVADITPDGCILVGTRLGGALCIGSDGRLRWHLSSSNVLPGNTVLDMQQDASGDLWLALGSGVAVAKIGTEMRLLSAFRPSVGDIYTAAYREPYLYLGTSEGLFRAQFADGRISGVSMYKAVEGHVPMLSFFDSQLFAGTNGATFEVAPYSVRQVSPVTGGSCMDKGVIRGREVLVQGTYTSLCVYVKQGGKWVFSHSVSGFMEPVSTLKIDFKGTVWAGHLHGGLFAIELSQELDKVASVRRYDTFEGPVKVLSFDSRVVFTDGVSGFYTYDDLSSGMVPYEALNSALKGFSPFQNIVRAGPDRYWFISEREAVLMKWNGESLEFSDLVPYRILGGRVVDSGERIIPLPGGSYLFMLENALAEYKPGSGISRVQPLTMKPAAIRVRDRSKAAPDSLLALDLDNPRLPYRLGNISFRMSCPVSGIMEEVRFHARLEGLETAWSELHGAPEAAYNYLPAGSYRFCIEARSYDGTVLSAWEWPFSVKPPFWRSVWAWLIYIVLFLLAVLSLVNHFIHQHRKQLDRLERERLSEELKLKSKELASTTMGSIRKNEALISIKKELAAQKAALGKDYPDKYYHRICSVIDSQLGSEADWAVFEKNFDNIHENFFSTLRERYPSLTDTDLRFCAYLHLNLASKDIASLMNISLKGVEAARSRIRKKIQLPQNQSLTSFMIELK